MKKRPVPAHVGRAFSRRRYRRGEARRERTAVARIESDRVFCPCWTPIIPREMLAGVPGQQIRRDVLFIGSFIS